MTLLAVLLGTLLLKPALMVAGACGLASAFRRRSAAARHAAWAAAVLATLLLPVLSLVLPRLQIAAPRAWIVESGTAPGTLMPVPSLLGIESPPAPDARGAPAIDPAGGATRLGLGLLALWVLGVVLLGARRAGAELRVGAMLRRARAPTERLTRRLGHLSSLLGMRLPAGLRVSDEVASPAVAGALRPVVLLPAAAEAWSDADLRAVLVHELGHVARRDCLLNRLADVACILYWCNPLVRWGVRRMRIESERACDDLVVRTGAEPERYAQLLLHVAHADRSLAFGPLTAMARPHELESRLLAVLDARASREPLSRWTTAALAGLALVVAMPAAALSLHAAAPQSTAPEGPEPDRLGDSLASPASERIRQQAGEFRMPPGAARALDGPDSLLARQLASALDRTPNHEGDLVRERAYWALSRARDGRLTAPLLESLRADDWREQAYAAWALAVAADRRAVPQLLVLLEHPVWRLRAMAAYALRASADPRAERVMLAALADPAWQVRVEAVEYLAGLGGPDVSDRLRPRLEDRHVAVRLAAERALTR